MYSFNIFQEPHIYQEFALESCFLGNIAILIENRKKRWGCIMLVNLFFEIQKQNLSYQT
jgi:hypothetical protein